MTVELGRVEVQQLGGAWCSMLGSGHPVAWQWGDSELASTGAYCEKSAMQYFVAGLEAVDAVSMAAVKVAGIEKLGGERLRLEGERGER